MGALNEDERWAANASVRSVRVMRGGESPVITFQNFGGDRGVRMAQICKLQETLRMAEEGKRINYGSRAQLDADSTVGPTIDMKIAADRLMQLALAAPEIQRDAEAAASLRRSTEWGATATLMYPEGSQLNRHYDNCGNWVVIFSFGRSVDFFAGDDAAMLESGDAILFNGGTKYGAKHGIDKVYPHATVENVKRALPSKLGFLRPYRVSVQVRQSDPPASWGWPAPIRAEDGAKKGVLR